MSNILIRLVIIDDHAMLLEGMSLALEREHDIHIVGTARSRTAGLAVCADLQPDVAVIDYRIGSDSGVDLARDLRTASPTLTIVGMSAQDSGPVINDMVEAGCVSFVHKQRGIHSLASAIRDAHDGVGHVPARAQPTGPDNEQLSRRELEVLQLMSEGKAPAEIAVLLFLSVHTVRNHVREIRRKLGVSSQLAAVAVGIRSGLILGPEPT